MKLRVLIADVRSVHNVGSIFRTADAVGVEEIIICGITPTPLDRFGKVREDFAKVALGAEKSVAWRYEKSAMRAAGKLAKDGWTTIAIEQSSRSLPYYEIARKCKTEGKICLIVGNEVDGISSALLKKADMIAEIPMSGVLARDGDHPKKSGIGKESLNVAVSFGIFAFALRFSGESKK